ncbi:hypothetical protein BGW42_003366 [Actinomortierella wolfii]|nr:hypothetical protein BGW42_003366 [Actinomortierella wolfii]
MNVTTSYSLGRDNELSSPGTNYQQKQQQQQPQQQEQQHQHSTSATTRKQPPLLPPALPWFADWIRWRAIDPKLTHDKLVPPEKRSLDLIYAWVNGSDASLRSLRGYFEARSPIFHNTDAAKVESTTIKRFRDMDELRFSLRSVVEYATDAVRNIYLMASPLPDSPTASPWTFLNSSRTQTPDWFDAEAAQPRPFHLVNHIDFFSHKDHLPSFSSLAIEANMANIPGLATNFIYLNDDIFIGQPVNMADFWTPLYGYVFHMEGSLRVSPTLREVPSNPLDIGEWHSLQYSNVLLSRRFGARHRAYVAHIVHIFNKDILDEIHQLWPEEFLQTSSHRFRGEGEAKDINTSFMFAHYIVERLREVQLEAFWKHSVDSNSDGELDFDERQWLVDKIKEWNDGEPTVFRMARDHLQNHKEILDRFGMTLTGTTAYRLSGIDGFPYLIMDADTSKSIHNEEAKQVPYKSYESHAKRQCKIDIDFCLGNDFGDASIPVLSQGRTEAIFQRFFRDEFHCGDCLLEMAMHHRDLGMRALFPADESSPEHKQLVQHLERYQYVLGTSEYAFTAISSAYSAEQNLEDLWDHRDKLAFMCINDDYHNDPVIVQKIQHFLQSFLTKRYPNPAPWEKYLPEEIVLPTG